MGNKTRAERRAAHQAYEQRRMNQEKPIRTLVERNEHSLIPGRSISLEAFGNVFYAGDFRGKNVFLSEYDWRTRTVKEIAVREGGLELIPGFGYKAIIKPVTRKVELSQHRHGDEAVQYFIKGGVA